MPSMAHLAQFRPTPGLVSRHIRDNSAVKNTLKPQRSLTSLASATLIAGMLIALSACGQKGPLCMTQPRDGSSLPGNVPVCPK